MLRTWIPGICAAILGLSGFAQEHEHSSGEKLGTEGKKDEGLRQMELAAELEDGTEKSAVTRDRWPRARTARRDAAGKQSTGGGFRAIFSDAQKGAWTLTDTLRSGARCGTQRE